MADALGETAPDYRAFGGSLKQTLRYGENPHQVASFYVTGEKRPGVSNAEQLQGKGGAVLRLHFVEHGGIVCCVHNYCHIGVVLRCRADHGRSANVDIPARPSPLAVHQA